MSRVNLAKPNPRWPYQSEVRGVTYPLPCPAGPLCTAHYIVVERHTKHTKHAQAFEAASLASARVVGSGKEPTADPADALPVAVNYPQNGVVHPRGAKCLPDALHAIFKATITACVPVIHSSGHVRVREDSDIDRRVVLSGRFGCSQCHLGGRLPRLA